MNLVEKPCHSFLQIHKSPCILVRYIRLSNVVLQVPKHLFRKKDSNLIRPVPWVDDQNYREHITPLFPVQRMEPFGYQLVEYY